MNRLLLLSAALVVCLTSLAPAADQQATAERAVRGFFEQHCYDCHASSEAEGDLRLDQLALPSEQPETLSRWALVLDALQSGEMPPREYDRPAETEIEQLASQVTRSMAQAKIEKPVSLRRLNRREYENTVHDLLGIEVPLVDLLPQDGSVQGFDNVSDGLSISSVLMEQYLEAANVAFDASIRRIKPLPAETRHVELMQVKDNIESVKKNKGGVIEVEGSFVKFTPGWPPARIDPVHPIEDGVYRCRVAVWPHDPGDRTIAVAIYVGTLFGPETRKFIGIFDATGTPDKPRVIEFTTHMEVGDSIHIVPRVWPEHVTWRDKHEKRPGLGIAWAETHGPLDQSFPSEAQKKLFGDVETISLKQDSPVWMRDRDGVYRHVVESETPEDDARRIVRNLIDRAFRRPVSDAEAEPFIRLTLDRLAQGRSFEEAVRAGVCAVLCSPQFLLLNREPEVDNYTLASRLSYFLWSTMPDDRLLQLAAEGKLSDPQVRRSEVDRLLNDPRSQQFVDNFTGQWLDLRDIEFTTPDGKLYPEFDPLLQEAMLGETKHFFRHILQEDLSLMNFIDSDFTFLNQRLASHYEIPGVRGHERFEKVTLPEESIRGGVLTQASVLKVTANGTTSSPVIRGVWVLDHLLGRPAPPPPPGVPAVEPDIRGAETIREQLEMHRESESCNSCHKRIDPPGFALEEFDVIGGKRDFYRSLGEGEKISGNKKYRRGPDVESSATMADGRELAGFRQFRERLVADRDRVAQAMATKLLVYGTGRPITPVDRSAVEQIVSQAEQHDLGFRSMIHAVVESPAFVEP